METPEQKVFEKTGIRIESKDVKPWAISTLYRLSQAHNFISHPIISGKTPPQDGPVIWIGNHTSNLDSIESFETARRTTGRHIRTVVKRSLVDPFFQESQKIQDRTGKSDRFLAKLLSLPLTYPQARLMRGLGVIDIDRGNPDRTFLKRTDAILDNKEMLGIFLQETRHKNGLLEDLMTGAAIIARRHPDVPIVPLGIWTPLDDGNRRVNIGAAFSYNELLADIPTGRLSIAEVTAAMGDRIAALLSPRAQIHWQQTRFQELQRLANPR